MDKRDYYYSTEYLECLFSIYSAAADYFTDMRAYYFECVGGQLYYILEDRKSCY